MTGRNRGVDVADKLEGVEVVVLFGKYSCVVVVGDTVDAGLERSDSVGMPPTTSTPIRTARTAMQRITLLDLRSRGYRLVE